MDTIDEKKQSCKISRFCTFNCMMGTYLETLLVAPGLAVQAHRETSSLLARITKFRGSGPVGLGTLLVFPSCLMGLLQFEAGNFVILMAAFT
jgi:hypothetical protein